jgi:hypothetical protein
MNNPFSKVGVIFFENDSTTKTKFYHYWRYEGGNHITLHLPKATSGCIHDNH